MDGRRMSERREDSHFLNLTLVPDLVGWGTDALMRHVLMHHVTASGRS